MIFTYPITYLIRTTARAPARIQAAHGRAARDPNTIMGDLMRHKGTIAVEWENNEELGFQSYGNVGKSTTGDVFVQNHYVNEKTMRQQFPG